MDLLECSSLTDRDYTEVSTNDERSDEWFRQTRVNCNGSVQLNRSDRKVTTFRNQRKLRLVTRRQQPINRCPVNSPN